MTLTERSVPNEDLNTEKRPRRARRTRWIATIVAVAVMAGYLTLPSTGSTGTSEAALSNPITIMLVGDSITSGRAGQPNETPTYRGPLYDKLALGAHNVDFVGSGAGIDNNGQNVPPPIANLVDPDHEGHNGWRADEMVHGHAGQPTQGKISDWMAAEMPDIVVLYAGANDQHQGETASEVYADLVEAIQAIQAAKPDVRILVSNHHPPRNNPTRDAQIAQLNPVIPELQKLSTATSPVVTVDIFTGYPSSALANGSHPGPAGQAPIGPELFEALENSGFLSDNTPSPSIDTTSKNADRGVFGEKITVTGSNIMAGFTADLGAGVEVVSTNWNNQPAGSSIVDITINVDQWTSPGSRDIRITNPDGDVATCTGCFTVNSTQTQPPLKIMILGGETVAGRRYVPAEEPTFRGDLFDLITGAGVRFDFVGSQMGVGSGDDQTRPIVPLGDMDHEGHAAWHVQELIIGKATEAAQGKLQDWLDAHDPDVVVLFAGQQDVRNGQSNLGVVNELKVVVSDIRDHNPDVRIVVTNINRHKDSVGINNEIDDYNSFFAANAGTAFTDTASSPIATADVSAAAINSSTYPNAAGNAHIATQIFNALNSRSMLDPVDQPPGPAGNLAATPGINELAFTWTAPPPSGFEGTPLTGYQVTLNPGGVVQNLGAGATSATFSGLDSSTEYTVTVVAENAAGNGPGAQASASPQGTYETVGYWMVRSNGEVFAFGGAADHGEPFGSLPGGVTAVAIAGHPQGGGYWVLASNGRVYAYGSAAHLGDPFGTLPSGETVTSIAAHPDGNGYWVFTDVGRAINYGSAAHFGDLVTLGIVPNDPVIAATPTASGDGYFMVGADGGLFNFGGAVYVASVPEVLPGVVLNQPIVGIVPDPDGSGYFMIAADGGVFAFDALFAGSLPGLGITPVHAINGMVPFGSDGYIAVGADGGLFSFGSGAQYFGSLPDQSVGPFAIVEDVVAVTASYALGS